MALRKKILLAVGLPVLYLVTWVLSMIVSIYLLESLHMTFGSRRVNAHSTHYLFPVLVITPAQNRDGFTSVIETYGSPLDNYIKANPKYSFLVPSGKLDEVNRQLAQHFEDSHSSSIEKVKILWSKDGKQYLKVDGDLGEELVACSGWYVADSKKVTPKKELIFRGRLLSFESMPCGALLNLVGWAVGSRINHRKRRVAK